MKVSIEHQQEIRQAIDTFLAKLEERGITSEALRERYRNGDIPRADAVQDIDMRFRWDLYWAASRLVGGLPDSTNGYNTKHIDTALRAIVPSLSSTDK